MSSNLANIYATLLRKYGENYMITYAVAPTYLNNILGPSEKPGKIVLVFVEDRSKAKALDLVSPSKLNIKKLTDVKMDLTGSPLKDDCSVDAIGDMSLDIKLLTTNPWKREEEYHKGIAIDKARNILSSEDFQRGSDTAVALGSVWFLCNGADASKTLLFQYEFVRNFCVRGIIMYMGLVPSCSVNSESLLQQHFPAIGREARVETHIENNYHIKSNISIKCSWSTTSMIPSLIDLSTSDVTLTQTFSISDCTPSTEHFVNQLRILMTIRDDILSYKHAENSDIAKEPIYRSGIAIDIYELNENINKLMTEISEIDSSSGDKSDIEDVIQNAKIRRLNDLTDKLWEILKLCSSYKDLKMAFNILFQCAARCNIVNTPTNKNRLAEMITAVANRRLAIPCLTGSEPLELLLEIGLEKLFKDYEYIFVESKVCSANDLKNTGVVHENKENDAIVPNVRKSLRNAVTQDTAVIRKTLLTMDSKSISNKIQSDIIGFRNSNFDEHETAKTLAKLLQIHCTLEHLLLIHNHLNLSSVFYQVCNQLLRKAPRTVERISDSLTDEMEIQIPAHYVREHLEGKDPQSRRIIMKSKNASRKVKSTFYFNMENICPPNISECSMSIDEKEYNTENVYYNWLYRKISTVKRH